MLQLIRSFRLGPGAQLVAGAPAAPGPDATRLLHLSDLHLGKPREPDPREVFDAWLDALDSLDPDAIVVSGDLVEEPDDAERLREARDALDATGLPWFAVPGNHDIATPGDDEAPFYEIFGAYPRLERLGDIAIVLLDSHSGYPLSERPESEREYAREHGAFMHGRVGAAQLDAVGAEIEGATWAEALVVVVHHHVLDDPGQDPDDTMRPLDDAEMLLRWTARHGPRRGRTTLVLHGHKHAYRRPSLRDEIAILRGGASSKTELPARLIDLGARALLWEYACPHGAAE